MVSGPSTNNNHDGASVGDGDTAADDAGGGGGGGGGVGELGEEEAFTLSLTPHFHAFMLGNTRRNSCCPIMFERAAPTWWDPRFDSEILEGQYQHSSQPTFTLHFQYGLLYTLVNCAAWSVYYLVTRTERWYFCLSTCLVLAAITAALLVYSRTNHYLNEKKQMLAASLVASFTLMLVSLLPFALHKKGVELDSDLSSVAMFAVTIEVLLHIYTLIPLPLYMAVTFSTLFSILTEILNYQCTNDNTAALVIVRIILHVCIHLIGAHIMIMTQVRMRGTFMSIGQSLVVRQQLEYEKALKEKMIHSVMPPKVADWLMKENPHTDDVDDINYIGEEGAILRKVSSPRSSNTGDLGSIFRPFNMNALDDVSILFADIVGFTKMSSNKTAEQLVGLLNDLFRRFDELCRNNSCEKISTLGDCYYSVCGCPEPHPDHANCCVNMGLDMIDAIIEFDKERNESVNMRVGVHTGKVLCGIVGTKRFKFDVWSNDVTLANQMESTGRPGQVHISEATYRFLPKDDYIVEEGQAINIPDGSIKTYFITGRIQQAEQQTNIATLDPKDSRGSYKSAIKTSKDNKKASSMPNILECGSEDDESNANRTSKVRIVQGFHNMRLSQPPTLEWRLRLPKIHKTNDKAKAKTTSLPKISSKNENNTGKSEEWREIWSDGLIHEVAEDAILRRRINDSGDETCVDLMGPPTIINTSSPHIPPPPCNHHIKSPNNNTMSSSFIPEQQPTTTPTPNTPDPTTPNTPDPGGTTNQDPLTPIKDKNIKNSWGNISMKDPRKDSGIRSRRSSINAQLFSVNGMSPGDLLTHRTSGYYTSSQSSMADQRLECGDVSSVGESGPIPLNETLTRFHQLRKQSDLQLIRCMQNDNNHKQYNIVPPPLSSMSLFFVNRELEKQYRQQVHRPRPNDPPTLASPQFNTYFDILVSMLVYTGVSISVFLLYPPPTLRWLLLCPISAGWHLVVFLICQSQVVRQEGVNSSSTLATQIYKWITRWHPWHVCGASLICLPLVAVFTNFSCTVIKEEEPGLRFFCYLIFVSLIHLCNFTQLNCWMKSILATVATILFLGLVVHPICPCPNKINNNADELDILRTVSSSSQDTSFHYFHVEVILSSILLLFLVWILNREFEISYRLSYHGSVVAMKDKIRVENMKDQADWLLHNIIPRHVADSIKTTAKYSENHKGVAVLFASIVNFNELYDEDYLGGKEYLRVLNELVADFDELLVRPQFKNIEKIKTIGSTYMAASGLNPEVRNSNIDAHQHIFELVEFAMAMQGAIANFNKDLIEFELYLRVGLNFGDVTAGVIGTTKLYYDIWGDTVNIASRMDTTGMKDNIQVSQDCARVLSRRYELVPRGQVYVKGKDNMNVFLLKGYRKDLPPDT